jgi:hypothetical protein
MESNKERGYITDEDLGILGSSDLANLVKSELEAPAPDFDLIARCMMHVPYEEIPLFNIPLIESDSSYEELMEIVAKSIKEGNSELHKKFLETTSYVTNQIARIASVEDDEPSSDAESPRLESPLKSTEAAQPNFK